MKGCLSLLCLIVVTGLTPAQGQSIGLEKATNGHDADAAPGPTLSAGDSITWTYVVRNTGNLVLNVISVTDDQGVDVSCPLPNLGPGASMTCSGSGIAQVGQYRNLGTARGSPRA